jgi:hypothetical protein
LIDSARLFWQTFVYTIDSIIGQEEIMKKSTLFWGTVLVLFGFLLLLDNLNLLPVKIWDILWPLLLVLLGIAILVGSLTARRSPETEHLIVPLEGASRVNLRINHGAGRLRLEAGMIPGNLAEGDFTGGLDLRIDKIGDALDVEMGVPTSNFPTGPWFYGRRALDWSVALNAEVPISLVIHTGANEADFDLTGLKIPHLHLSTGASSTRLRFPESAGYTSAKVEAGAASVAIRIPQTVAARIHSQGGLASISVDQARFERLDSGVYQSPGYESAENRVDLEVHAGVGSVDIR